MTIHRGRQASLGKLLGRGLSSCAGFCHSRTLNATVAFPFEVKTAVLLCRGCADNAELVADHCMAYCFCPAPTCTILVGAATFSATVTVDMRDYKWFYCHPERIVSAGDAIVLG